MLTMQQGTVNFVGSHAVLSSSLSCCRCTVESIVCSGRLSRSLTFAFSVGEQVLRVCTMQDSKADASSAISRRADVQEQLETLLRKVFAVSFATCIRFCKPPPPSPVPAPRALEVCR